MSVLSAVGCELIAGIEERTFRPDEASGGGTPGGVGTGTTTGGGQGGQSCDPALPECAPAVGGPELDRWPDSSPHCFGGLAECPAGEDGARVGARAYSDLGDGTVRDEVTGLLWQQAVSDHVHFHDNAATYCSNLPASSAGVWRLPGFHELLSLVDYGIDPLLPAEFAVPWIGATVNDGLWVREPVPQEGGTAWHYYFMFDHDWSIDDARFEGGEATWGGKVGLVGGPLRFALCVSGEALVPSPVFEHCCDPPVLRDATTGLVWQAYPSADKRSWQASLAHCDDLPDLDGGWRLATAKELGTLFKPDGERNVLPPVPAVDAGVGGVFWTSTPSIKQTAPARVFVVDFTTTSAYEYPIRAELPSDLYRAWCVRSYDSRAP
ncbi:MAG: DUF1566 domain-containing protein [Deltaproteobacteria bacterium]|nr:DUF1566 domain-containing protein [Deltaproteobacteria bacterium]MBW2532639.1 DUF1566 domain-containing protein [Deltaproteobacteria bacterium]